MDAYIFMRYRCILSRHYERLLQDASLNDCVVAYRRTTKIDGSGKSTIDLAKDAFDFIKKIGDCYTIALDIEDFFGSLDHRYLQGAWLRLLNEDVMPPDHEAVWRAITRYSSIDRLALLEELRLYGVKGYDEHGKPKKGLLCKPSKLRGQICTPEKFRNDIVRSTRRPRLVWTNYKSHGIPQGAPISDLLANIYLFEFDRLLEDKAVKLGGKYMRYSDDILLIVPIGTETPINLQLWIGTELARFGSKLKIKAEKTVVHQFRNANGHLVCTRLHGSKARNGFEYLGFRFDGRSIYLRDSTLSNLRRKIVRAAKRACIVHAKRHGALDAEQLIARFNLQGFVNRFMRNEHFRREDVRSWTFWTYAKSAQQIFGQNAAAIARQLRGIEQFCGLCVKAFMPIGVKVRDRPPLRS